MINRIDKSRYNITERHVQMKSNIRKVVHYTPKFTEEERRRVEKEIGAELYEIFKNYVKQ